jgi:hypothetical protein
MSQHFFTTTHEGRPVELLMGFDRPLQGFFMVVSRLDARDDEDEIVYCNLNDRALAGCAGLPQRLDHFLTKLAGLGIHVPPEMLDEIERDALANRGNRHVVYDGEGRKVSDC